ncbi:MAG: GHMP family kinase ATP-binding protein [Fimbriimonadaceae bacterium]
MIISRTPLRVSFAGGGTDLPAYYNSEPGAVVSTAIDKYIYINVNEKFDHKIRASYSVTEIVDRRDEVQHELIRHSMEVAGIDGGIEITSISDIPSQGTGLGSSSSYTVGLLNAFYAHLGKRVGSARLAREACEIELDRCGKPIGKQDQFIAAFGGLQYIQFNPDGTVFADPIICRPDTKRRLEDRLLMLYTGLTRSADVVLQTQSANTSSSAAHRQTLRRMKTQADEIRASLENNDLGAVGELLHEGWMLKRTLASGITSPDIDAWYEIGRSKGAKGGKLLGAGGGGFLLFFAEPETHAEISAALPHLRRVQVELEPQGSKIVYIEEHRRA